jgi:uncharacterized protein (DUF2235 family)
MKRLIVCFDGTWNAADSEKSETNVARIARAIRANSGDDGVQQIVMYERGVGTSGLKLANLLAGATGLGVGDNIRSAYMTLAQNYVPGDEVFLFGFSRGAFSARSLAGFIAACGLLKRQKLGDINKAWAFYREAKLRNPQEFIARNSTEAHEDVPIKFMGVWDTVGALGIPLGTLSKISGEVFEFHDTSPSRIIRYGAHALAIDEKRDEFVPTLWTGAVPVGNTIEQVWFAGCHSDVGGGYDERRMADIPLRWMAQRAETQGLKLDWESGVLPKPDANLDALSPVHESRTGISSKDRLSPTIRRVCELKADVSVFEKLYAPRDNKGKILPTINEFLHESVLERYGRDDALSSNDDKLGKNKRTGYRPKNIQAAFLYNGKFKEGVAVAR